MSKAKVGILTTTTLSPWCDLQKLTILQHILQNLLLQGCHMRPDSLSKGPVLYSHHKRGTSINMYGGWCGGIFSNAYYFLSLASLSALSPNARILNSDYSPMSLLEWHKDSVIWNWFMGRSDYWLGATIKKHLSMTFGQYLSLSPSHLDTKSDEETDIKVELFASVATALARYDFPVPGGYKRKVVRLAQYKSFLLHADSQIIVSGTKQNNYLVIKKT